MNNRIKSEQDIIYSVVSYLQNDYGVNGEIEYRVNLSNGRSLDIDFLISYPIEAIVEIKTKYRSGILDQIISHYMNISSNFLRKIPLIAVIPELNEQSINYLSDNNVFYVEYDSHQEDIGHDIAFKIFTLLQKIIENNKIDHQLFYKNSLEFKKLDVRQFNDVYSNFKHELSILLNIIGENNLDILGQELQAFTEEYKNKHYTSAMMRVGRSLEHIFYCLAKANNVSISGATIEFIEKFEGKNANFQSAMMKYFTSVGDEKEKFRKEAIQICKKMLKHLSNVENVFEVDPGVIDKEQPLNVPKIITALHDKYKDSEIINKKMSDMKIRKRVVDLMRKRNNAAHANINGQNTNVEKSDIDEIIEEFRSLLRDVIELGREMNDFNKNSVDK